MSKVEETIEKYSKKSICTLSGTNIEIVEKENVLKDLKEIRTEQEELQKKADKYDELMGLAVATNTPADAIKPFNAKDIKLADYEQLQDDLKKRMDLKQAKGIIEKETGVTIPHNFEEVWEARGQIAALMNTVSFELDKRNDERSYEQFIWDSLNNSKPVEIPAYVAKWIEDYRKNYPNLSDPNFGLIAHLDDYFTLRNGAPDDLDKGYKEYMDAHCIDFIKAWLYGYAVKQEPKFHILLANMYFCGWGEDGTEPTFNLNSIAGEEANWLKVDEKEGREIIEQLGSGTLIQAREEQDEKIQS